MDFELFQMTRRIPNVTCAFDSFVSVRRYIWKYFLQQVQFVFFPFLKETLVFVFNHNDTRGLQQAFAIMIRSQEGTISAPITTSRQTHAMFEI